jgi:cobalt-precorrin 5A hydrolase
VDELARARGMALENLPAAKGVSAALLEGRAVQVFDPEGRLLGDLADGETCGGLLVATDPADWDAAAPGVWCHWRTGGVFPATFRVYPRCLCLGLGSRKNVPEGEILAHIATVFAQQALSLQSVVAVGTASIKRDDPGLCAAAAALGPEVVFHELEALAAVDSAGQSETVRRRTGTGSVSEAAALLLSGGGELISPKSKTGRVTCAVALRRKGA